MLNVLSNRLSTYNNEKLEYKGPIYRRVSVFQDLKCHTVGASMVHSQICKGLRQLRPEQLSVLRQQLVASIVAHASVPQPSNQQIAVRLTLAVSVQLGLVE